MEMFEGPIVRTCSHCWLWIVLGLSLTVTKSDDSRVSVMFRCLPSHGSRSPPAGPPYNDFSASSPVQRVQPRAVWSMSPAESRYSCQ